MIDKVKESFISILIGLSIVLCSAGFLYFYPPFIQKATRFLDDNFYHLKLRYAHRPLNPNTPITIVDIDDRSLAALGRWPWPRKQLAELVTKLHEEKASVVAFDILFSEPQANDAQQVIDTLQEENQNINANLEELLPLFDEDLTLAKALAQHRNVGAFTVQRKNIREGVMPAPFFSAENVSFLIDYPGYIANIEPIAKALSSAGAINSSPDRDGVLRFSPMLLKYHNALYPSLSLAATTLFLNETNPTLVTGRYQDGLGLEAVKIAQKTIPLTTDGKVLIPFRGGPRSFTYVSALDVLKGKAPKELLENRLIFIGSSATGLGDLFPTAIAPIFAGVEIHASIAAGILDSYFPFNPTWAKGISILLILLLGIPCAILLPLLGPLMKNALFFSLSAMLFFWDFYLWKEKALVVSVLSPVLTLFVLYLFNVLNDYFLEAKKEKHIRAMFGQYISPDYLQIMLKSGQDYELKGENKELSVLFADIWKFTQYAEKLSAPELKHFLNEFFTPMTETVFETHGTIDKYVGDMIMAFWGAPLPDQDHAPHAVEAALLMQEKLKLLSEKGFAPIQIGIGINTGMMNVGDMGSQFRRAYTVLGDSVNLASRLESLTRRYHVPILVSSHAKEKAPGYTYKTIDKVQVKGKQEAVLVYQPMRRADELLNQHEEAISAYFKQDFDRAESLFSALEKSNPELYQLYKTRIEHLKSNPPPPDWNGAFVYDEK